ncbi:NAD-glutamate dehydrogenase [bacterium]|nr:NAD-glutamate dehydrogenase [bacterium]
MPSARIALAAPGRFAGQIGASTSRRAFSSSSSSSRSWLAAVGGAAPSRSDELSLKERTATDLGEELQRLNVAALAAIHPWFVSNMSPAYFDTVAPATQTRHIESLAYMYSMHREPDISYQGQHGELTVIMSGEGTGLSRELGAGGNPQVLSMLESIPDGKTLQSINKYTSLDGTITIVNVTFNEQDLYRGTSTQEIAVRDKVLAYAASERPDLSEESITDFLAKCSSDHVTRTRKPVRLLDQMLMYQQVAGSDDTEVSVEALSTGQGEPRWLISIAGGNSQPKLYLSKIASYLGVHGISIRRLYLDLIADEASENPTMMLRVVVARPAATEEAGEITAQLQEDIKKLKWIDDKVINIATRHEHISFGEAEVITALASLVHGPLSKKNRHAFTRTGLFDLLEKPENLAVAEQIAGLFLSKFSPSSPLTGDALTHAAAEIRRTISPGSIEGQALLEAMLDGVMKTIRTNYFVPSRYALGLRLDPSFMGVNEVVGDVVPFGTFFITGRRFVSFHVRNRDISRGGLRVVQPVSMEAHGVASAGAYDEAYALAFAQQLKNKDIPEGGSKAVCVVEPYGDPDIDHFLQRKSIKAFSDTLLDFMSVQPEVTELITDVHAGGLQDIVYLGPDENVIPDDINWMTDRATARGYQYASAFISSKPVSSLYRLIKLS